MPNSSGARRLRTIWRVGSLSLAVCLGAGSGGLGAEQRPPANATVSPEASASLDTEVDPTASHDDFVDPLNEALAGLGARLGELARVVEKAQAERAELAALKEQNQQLLARITVVEAELDRLPDALKLAKELSEASDAAAARVRDLVAELIAERGKSAELGADLAAAKAERAQIEQAARANEAALAAWIHGLHDELAEHGAQLADAGAARAQTEARLETQARVAQAERARAAKQRAVMQDQLRERDREIAAARTESADLLRRLDAARSEVRRRGAANARLAAELAAARGAADFATVMVQDSLAVIDAQIGVLHAAAGDTPPDSTEKPAGMPSATMAGALSPVPYAKPRLQASDLDARAPAWDTADGGAAAAAIAVVEDGAWMDASLRDNGASNPEPTTDRAPFLAPDSREIGDVISTAALLADPLGPGPMDESSVDLSKPPLEWGDRAGLIAAASRLADGLRATREEAMFQRQERVFTVDVEERAFAPNPAAGPVPLDPALDIRLFTAESELVDESQGGIRFYPDGSSTGGRIELQLLGDRAAVNVQWSTGVVTVER